MSLSTRHPTRRKHRSLATKRRRVPPCTEAGLPDPSALTPNQIAKLARGIASPVRVQILQLFAEGSSLTTGEIVEASGLAQSTVSEHLRFLRDAELVSARKDGPRVWYCLRRSVLRNFMQELDELAADPPARIGSTS